MKKILFLFAICHFALVTASAQRLSDKYTEKRPVVIVCDWDKPPYEFLNDKGQPAGSDIDVMSAIMKGLGLPCKFVMKEASVAQKTFERGDADLILSKGGPYRRKPYVISKNVINYSRICVAMHGDSTNTISWRQLLEEKDVVFNSGDQSVFSFIKDSTDDEELLEYQMPTAALMGLMSGDYKYYVWEEEPLKWKINELDLDGISLNEVNAPVNRVRVIGRDRQLIEQIDDQFSRLNQQGEIAVLQDKWLHPERVEEQAIPVASYITCIALLLLLAGLISFFSRLSKKRVINATRNSTELNDMMHKALHMGNFKVMIYDIASDRMTNYYGDILPEKGLTLEEFTHRIHPDQQQEFVQKMWRLMEGRDRHFDLNKRWNAGTDEEPHWQNFHGHAIVELDVNGRPAHVINAIHDVTPEVEEDKAARELVRKYERLSNMPFIAISFYDKDGWLIDLNDNMKELFGISDDNPETKRYWEKVCMFDIPLFRSICTPGSREDVLVCQHMEFPELGLNRYIELHITPLFDTNGDIANYFFTAIDVTADRTRDHVQHLQNRELSKTTSEIEHRKEQLAYLLENSSRYLMRSDVEKQVVYFYRQLGQPEIALSFDEYINENRAPEERERARQVLNNEAPLHSVEGHFSKSLVTNKEGWLDISANPFYDKNGKFVGHIGIAVDVTEYVLAKQRLQEEEALANDSVRMKSAFLASMTHELRTPLNAIVGFTGVLEALTGMPERKEYLRIIRNSSDMLQRLINDIIEASSFTGGTVSIEPKPVDFSASFDNICLALSQRVQNPEVEFLKDNPYDTFPTTLDTDRIFQVLTNFTTNAVKFTQQGHIRVGYRYENGGLYLYCEDTGAGIPKNKQNIVFERFVKLDEFVQGTGMGLAVSKSIVEHCNGKIGVDSEGEGKGSTFWMWIPCEREA
ncbi:MAG: PAS domain-containing protein [Prevotella sp.]|nr:PAS domain-containing protein [Prevotella sp.]